MANLIELQCGRWRCTVAPALGGAILRLRDGDCDVLRHCSPDEFDVLQTASFPLVPFANRIDRGRMTIDGMVYQLDAEPIVLPHAHHGHGWRRPWVVAGQTPDRAILEFEHDGRGGWIWPYSARQELEVTDDGLVVQFTVTNRDPVRRMPAGCGLHPYFPRGPHSSVRAKSAAMWRNDVDGLAVERVTDARFATARAVAVAALEGLDNYFEARSVAIHEGDNTWVLGGDGMRGFHLYVPAGEDHFCVEPVSHAPNAFGRVPVSQSDLIASGDTRVWEFSLCRGEGVTG